MSGPYSSKNQTPHHIIMEMAVSIRDHERCEHQPMRRKHLQLSLIHFIFLSHLIITDFLAISR